MWVILLSWMSVFYIQAQTDGLPTSKFQIRSTLFGIGYTNILDTYLSPVEYKGMEIRMLRENMKMTDLMDGQVSSQSMFQLYVSITKNHANTGNEWGGILNGTQAWHYHWEIGDLKLLAGPMIDLNFGFLYNTRNSNNPAQAIANINLDASGMAIYHFHIKKHPLIARYQLNIPFAGVMFSPDYGQSYYEIFELEHSNRNVLFTSVHNRPSFRQFLTLDVPVRNSCIRIGYMCDIQQSKVNYIKSHQWSHTLMLGFVKTLFPVKERDRMILSSPYNPF